MNNALCLQLPSVGMPDDSEKLIYASLKDSRPTKWFEPRFEATLQPDKIIQTCMNLISAKQFQRATDFMLNEIYEHSQVLAKTFGKTLDDLTGISSLFDELMLESIIGEEERNRLNVLQMVLDGIDIEVHECGKNLKGEETSYLLEFLEIVRNLLSKAKISVGYSIWNPEDYHFTSQDRTVWASGQNIDTIVANIVTTPMLNYAIVNLCNTNVPIAFSTNQSTQMFVTTVQVS